MIQKRGKKFLGFKKIPKSQLGEKIQVSKKKVVKNFGNGRQKISAPVIKGRQTPKLRHCFIRILQTFETRTYVMESQNLPDLRGHT